MPTLTSRAANSEGGITLANVVLVAALLALAYSLYVTYGNSSDAERASVK